MLVAATNPCPCGYYGDEEEPCTCTHRQMQLYRNRIGCLLYTSIHAERAVILTAGGFCNNKALLERYIPTAAMGCCLLYTSSSRSGHAAPSFSGSAWAAAVSPTSQMRSSGNRRVLRLG